MILWMYQTHRDEIVRAQERIVFQNVLLKKEIVVHLECPVKPDQKVCVCVFCIKWMNTIVLIPSEFKVKKNHIYVNIVRRIWMNVVFSEITWKKYKKKIDEVKFINKKLKTKNKLEENEWNANFGIKLINFQKYQNVRLKPN